tara:strand:- start:698 stop:1261 length:564 start_codon:yes stop_codon:yes gene_type:complete
MSNDINQFISRIKDQGIIKPNKYQVLFAGHGFDDACEAAGFSPADANRLISDSCEEIAFPGSQIASKEFRVYGPPREMPYERLFAGDIDLTLRLDENMRLKSLFEEWMNVIVDPRTNNVTYYDDYICDMKIQIFSDLSDTAPVYEGTIIEVFPKQIDAIQLGFDQRDTYMKQKVGFSFRRIEQGFFI